MTREEFDLFIKKIHTIWKNRHNTNLGLGAVYPVGNDSFVARGNKAEKKVLSIVESNNKDWLFGQPPKSETIADIIGYFEKEDAIYILFIQVKSGLLGNLNVSKEKKEFPNFSSKIIDSFDWKKKKMIINFFPVYLPTKEQGFSKIIAYDYSIHNSCNGTPTLSDNVLIMNVFRQFEEFKQLKPKILKRNYKK